MPIRKRETIDRETSDRQAHGRMADALHRDQRDVPLEGSLDQLGVDHSVRAHFGLLLRMGLQNILTKPALWQYLPTREQLTGTTERKTEKGRFVEKTMREVLQAVWDLIPENLRT